MNEPCSKCLSLGVNNCPIHSVYSSVYVKEGDAVSVAMTPEEVEELAKTNLVGFGGGPKQSAQEENELELVAAMLRSSKKPDKAPKDDMEALLDETLGSTEGTLLNEEHVKFLDFMWGKQVDAGIEEGDPDAHKARAFYGQLIQAIRQGIWVRDNRSTIIEALTTLRIGVDEISFLSFEEKDKLKVDCQKALDTTVQEE